MAEFRATFIDLSWRLHDYFLLTVFFVLNMIQDPAIMHCIWKLQTVNRNITELY